MDKKSSKSSTMKGSVISCKMDSSVLVVVERQLKHPLYAKTIRRTTKLFAHDEHNECAEGDSVLIQETRPFSRNKNWKVVKRLSGDAQ